MGRVSQGLDSRSMQSSGVQGGTVLELVGLKQPKQPKPKHLAWFWMELGGCFYGCTGGNREPPSNNLQGWGVGVSWHSRVLLLT